jgi:hypothetical protein
MIAFILTEPLDDTIKSTLTSILIGFVLGVILTYLLSWGILALLGRKLIFKLGILLLALFIGIIGAVVGDAKAAYKRPLTAGEIYRAKKVFGNSLDYGKIKIAYNSRLMNFKSNRAPFNTIYLTKRMDSLSQKGKEGVYYDVLIHELTHTWQTQHGIGILKKLKTAFRVIFNRTQPYNFGKAEGLEIAIDKKQDFRDFNTEQQGEILAYFYCYTYHSRQKKRTYYEHFARQVQFNKGYHIEVDTFPSISYYMPIDSINGR